MPVKTEEYGPICVMTPSGDFVGAETDSARKAFEQLVDQKHIVDYVIDFEKTPFIDSQGLETLLWMKQRTEELFGQTKLANLDENCRKILEITRLAQRFECHADLTGALKTMR